MRDESQMEKPGPEKTYLQTLLEQHGLTPETPSQPWNFRKNVAEIVTFKSTELQKLLETHPDLKPMVPESIWNIRPKPETVTLRTTDLQKLLQSDSLRDKSPENAWTIRPGSSVPETVTLISTELQKLLESHPNLRPMVPEKVWRIRPQPEIIKAVLGFAGTKSLTAP